MAENKSEAIEIFKEKIEPLRNNWHGGFTYTVLHNAQDYSPLLPYEEERYYEGKIQKETLKREEAERREIERKETERRGRT